MPLLRAQKETLVEQLVSQLTESRVSLVVAYTRLHMKANDNLRTGAFEKGAKIKMLSNNLLELILKRLGRELDLPQKSLALAYGYEDEVEAAKSLVEFGKETDSLEILGGWIDGNFFDAAQVKTLSSLPGKEQLQAQLVGRLGGLIGSLAYSLNYPLQKFAYVISALEQKGEAKTDEEKPATTPVAEEAKVEELSEEPKAEVKSEEDSVESTEAKQTAEELKEEAQSEETSDKTAEESKEEVKEEGENNE